MLLHIVIPYILPPKYISIVFSSRYSVLSCMVFIRCISSVTQVFLMSKQSSPPPSRPTATLHRKDSLLVGSTDDVTGSK